MDCKTHGSGSWEGHNMNNNKKRKSKSIFKLSEELRQKLQKQKQERLYSLTAENAKSQIARQLILNATIGRIGGLKGGPEKNE